jgi:hypothetical protein
MMRSRAFARSLARAATCGALGAALLIAVCGRPALAEDAEEEAWDTRIIRNILRGIGLQDGSGQIIYRERSPLVVPKSLDLPPPQQADALQNNPQWPRDPETRRRVVAKKPKTVREKELEEDPSKPLTPAELEAGRRPGATRDSKPRETDKLMPSELGYRGGILGSLWGHQEKQAIFTREPERTSLTDPPPGYQTPSPTQPYAVRDEKSWLSRIPTWWDRPEGDYR